MQNEINNSMIHSQINSYEERQKEKLVELGKSNKSYKKYFSLFRS